MFNRRVSKNAIAVPTCYACLHSYLTVLLSVQIHLAPYLRAKDCAVIDARVCGSAHGRVGRRWALMPLVRQQQGMGFLGHRQPNDGFRSCFWPTEFDRSAMGFDEPLRNWQA